MKYLWAIVGLCIIGAIFFVVDRATTMPPTLSPDSVSSKIFAQGFYRVAGYPIHERDKQRPTPNRKGGIEQARDVSGMLWFPEIEEGLVAPGKHPVYLHIPSYTEDYSAFEHTAKRLASKGYIVVALDPNHEKKGNGLLNALAGQIDQTYDIRFTLDTLTAWNTSPDTPFYSRMDFKRITISGYSTGSISAQLAAFHPMLRDERIDAVVLIGPVSQLFDAEFYNIETDLPLLAVAANSDTVAPYEENAVFVASHHANTTLVNLKSGSHAGFSLANRRTRWLPNPDAINCKRLSDALKHNDTSVLVELRNIAPEVMLKAVPAAPCKETSITAIDPVRQYQLTLLAIQTFTESLFSDTDFERANAQEFLATTFAKENAEASVFLPVTASTSTQ